MINITNHDNEKIDVKTIDSYSFLELVVNDIITPKTIASYIIERGPDSNLICSYINKKYKERPLLDVFCSNAIIIYIENLNNKYLELDKPLSDSNLMDKIGALNTDMFMSIIESFRSDQNFRCFDLLVEIFLKTRFVSVEDFINIFKNTLTGCEMPEENYKRFDFMTNMYSIWKHYDPYGKFTYKDGKLMLYLYELFMSHNNKNKDYLYEPISDNEIYAYKRVTSEFKSFYDPNQKYIVGETYECNSDCDSLNDNSFGLNCWHKAGVKGYASGGRLLRVIININDITYCNLLDGSLRCSKFKVDKASTNIDDLD